MRRRRISSTTSATVTAPSAMSSADGIAIPRAVARGRPAGGGVRAPRIQGFAALGQETAELLDDAGIELLPRAASELVQRLGRSERLSVRAPRGHRLVSIEHREDPRSQRDLLAAQAAWIAGPVDVLVVAQDQLVHLGGELDRLQ